MSIIIRDIEQGTEEWLALRAGIPTCSELDKIITKTGKARTGDMPTSYMHRLIAEHVQGTPIVTGKSYDMLRGNLLEADAREWYSFMYDIEPEEVTFIYKDEDKLVGYSPDGLVGEDGAIEIKCPALHTHVGYLLNKALPDAYKQQVQGGLWVSEREWCDFISFHPDLFGMRVRVYRDEKYIKALAEAVNKFTGQMLEAREKLSQLRAA